MRRSAAKRTPMLAPTYVAYHSGLVNFRSEIALSLYSQISPFYRKTSLEGLNLVSKMDATKWNTNSHLEYSVRKNRTAVFRRSVAPGKVVFHTFQAEFLGTFPSKSWKKHGILIQLLDHFKKLLSYLLNMRRTSFELFTRKTVMNYWSIWTVYNWLAFLYIVDYWYVIKIFLKLNWETSVA